MRRALLGLLLVADLARGGPLPQGAWELRDAGREGGPAQASALVLASPGLSPGALDTWVEALEARGLDAWLALPPPDARLGPEEARELAAGVEPLFWELRARRALPVVLAGHGLGGGLALLAAESLPETWAVAAAGPPAASPSLVLRELLDEPAGPAARGRAELLWGGPPPLPPSALAPYATGLPLRPERVEAPVLVLAGALDRLAPPEALHPLAARYPRGRFLRLGLLHLDAEDPGHLQLLSEPRCAAVLARWLAERVEERRQEEAP